jgi:hypothetical protein
MAIQRSQREQPETLVLALLPNVNSLPFYGLATILIFIIGKALPGIFGKKNRAEWLSQAFPPDHVVFV